MPNPDGGRARAPATVRRGSHQTALPRRTTAAASHSVTPTTPAATRFTSNAGGSGSAAAPVGWATARSPARSGSVARREALAAHASAGRVPRGRQIRTGRRAPPASAARRRAEASPCGVFTRPMPPGPRACSMARAATTAARLRSCNQPISVPASVSASPIRSGSGVRATAPGGGAYVLGGLRCRSAMPDAAWRCASCLLRSAAAWRTAVESSSGERLARSRRATKNTSASTTTRATTSDTTIVVMPSTLRRARQRRRVAKSGAARFKGCSVRLRMASSRVVIDDFAKSGGDAIRNPDLVDVRR